jgi:hypothetical protein
MAYYRAKPTGRQCLERVKKIKQLMVTASGTGLSSRQRGEKPHNYTHRGLKAFNRRSIFSGGLSDINPGVWGS